MMNQISVVGDDELASLSRTSGWMMFTEWQGWDAGGDLVRTLDPV